MLDTSIQVIPEGNEHHGMSYLGIRLIYIWRSMLDPNIHNTKVDFKLKKGEEKNTKTLIVTCMKRTRILYYLFVWFSLLMNNHGCLSTQQIYL